MTEGYRIELATKPSDIVATVSKFEKQLFESLAVSDVELGKANLGESMMRSAYPARVRLKALQDIEAAAFFGRSYKDSQLAYETEEELLRHDAA